jgi:hypothetical protein
MCVCVCVCVLSAIEIETAVLISMKFGKGILINTGKVCSWAATPCDPWAQEGHTQGLACFCSLNHLTW